LSGILLDTHALFWLVSGENMLTEEALVAIGVNQAAGTLFVSPITSWELSVATQKTASPVARIWAKNPQRNGFARQWRSQTQK
jgi:PIN domain nuclease of toxin-antitoxin system